MSQNNQDGSFSWLRLRSTEEIGDFISRRLSALEEVALD